MLYTTHTYSATSSCCGLNIYQIFSGWDEYCIYVEFSQKSTIPLLRYLEKVILLPLLVSPSAQSFFLYGVRLCLNLLVSVVFWEKSTHRQQTSHKKVLKCIKTTKTDFGKRCLESRAHHVDARQYLQDKQHIPNRQDRKIMVVSTSQIEWWKTV